MPRTYFFRRKSNDEAFAVDGESEARRIVEHKRFRDSFEYLGWSTGETYAKMVRSKTKLSSSEHKRILETEEQDAERSEIARKAFEAELADALANPDKSLPRRLDISDENGNPIVQGIVAESVRMMRR